MTPLAAWTRGADGAGLPPDTAGDRDTFRAYRRGVAARTRFADSVLATPDRPSQGGHLLPPIAESQWPSRAVMSLFGPESRSDSDSRVER